MASSNRAQGLASLILRLGLAFVLAYVAIDSFREPVVWIGFLPDWATSVIAAKTLLDLFSVLQLVLAAALLWRRISAYAAVITTLLLVGIVLTDTSDFLIVFRDLGLACMAAAVAVLDWEKRL